MKFNSKAETEVKPKKEKEVNSRNRSKIQEKVEIRNTKLYKIEVFFQIKNQKLKWKAKYN